MTRALLLALMASSLALASCGGTSIGRPCTQDKDCEPGQTCYPNLAGGTCTKGCSAEGTARNCPGQTLCAVSVNLLLCSTECTEAGQCREGFGCTPVPGTSKSACTVKLP
ncbi:MAG: hypothetical protein ACYC8T_03890 [Myxococcaceae bacterium]